MFLRRRSLPICDKTSGRACNRIAGNLTRCVGACDFARATLDVLSLKRLTSACKAGERASAGDHNIDVGIAFS